ncbi:hypothetical protein P5815_27850 [Bacillus cereus]|uniref:hypothetical protein n=1 Tax=Bacillus cereus TaxID=1396 RepID=UPI0009B23869|nr:hypothetical protein [Bacillus cereus]MDF9524327.1 hypothetical protein [Bacillus cereus]MDF9563106.1 hypothetical protein [Bacillus cereus]PFS28815.1 hypothetical protein COK47_22850 [Bacillus cereus]
MKKVVTNHKRRKPLKEWTFTLVLIAIFLTAYIQKTGIEHVSLLKLLFIPAILVVAYFIDRKFAEYAG